MWFACMPPGSQSAQMVIGILILLINLILLLGFITLAFVKGWTTMRKHVRKGSKVCGGVWGLGF